MRFFTSDQHFGHRNIIRHCSRPFASVEEMDQAIIDKWNSVVTNADEVYVIGDFAPWVSLGRVSEILRSLNGFAKHLIMGNHDKHKSHHFVKAGFTDARKGEILVSRHKVDGESIPLYLQHHPIRMEHERRHDHWIVNGHVHQHWMVRRDVKCVNVGVDVHDFLPITEQRLIEIIASDRDDSWSGTQAAQYEE